ncbi:Pga2p NDAI_0F03060 [Naumovozyma dairenensis CBS 421]|uniref:Processing of GAS1 and ALP protein 2 n=1 Tax=Naumovozyma dairenensis (strain ATCC 10597 / BCRC 20456 / CBS 421 / NBRC 0211 / NRRL Y-12639) TaxID=1071378 RepID=G0WCW3_NAUDC|nr:hypothetical protein NDAI_0F03060 [Naumovozyma dairenensis CBS 421]CCD25624.1 hypothetical protein NDAI_0F03060 [Naumovozyma dairenensis CBS 421]
MEYLVNKIKTIALNTFADFDAKKGIRLVIVVGAYIFIRNYVAKELAKKQLERQAREDEHRISKEKKEKLIDVPEDEKKSETTAFGWGNKTRRRVKKQEEILEKAVENLQRRQLDDEDSDADIQDLLLD